MKWPWVSRLAFDLLKEELDRIREQNSELVTSLQRVRRFEAGMREEVKQPKPPDPQPPELWEIIREFDSKRVQETMMQEAQRAHAAGTPWSEIIALYEQDMYDDELEPEAD